MRVFFPFMWFSRCHERFLLVWSDERYAAVLAELKENGGSLSEKTHQELGIEVFRVTSHYDVAIYHYFKNKILDQGQKEENRLPHCLGLNLVKVQDLRYGENPHQKAAFYREAYDTKGLPQMKQLWGKELSFNNILDLNSAVNIVKEFSDPAAVFIKHNNPCGAAQNQDILKAYKQAWACDTLSAFGGIVALNREVDLALAKLIAKSGFLECVISPKFSLEALGLLKDKKNLRLLELPQLKEISSQLDIKRVWGGALVQDEDILTLDEKNLKIVTKQKPSKKEMESLVFAWKIAKHTKSNAIILAKGTKSVGIGAGQMSRVDSVFISTKKAGKLTAGAVLASDAFFPKEDAIVLAAKYRISAIIQPGGSIADQQIIQTADKCGIAMVFTGIRHFKH